MTDDSHSFFCRSEFLTTITHEIRTPIASVLGIMELLLQDDGLTSAQRDLVEKAAQSGETLLNLIGDVLVRPSAPSFPSSSSSERN